MDETTGFYWSLDDNKEKDAKPSLADAMHWATDEHRPALVFDGSDTPRAHASPRVRAIRRAHWAVASARRDGTLQRLPCELCGASFGVVAHHDDYAAPLAVRWLCSTHHALWHQQNGPGLNLEQGE